MADDSPANRAGTGEGFNRKALFAAVLPFTSLILPLIFGFFVSVAGVVIGWKARREIAQTGDRGLALATTGIVVGTLAAIACISASVYVWVSNG